ncbi:ArsR/SmtB family transcription factor [Prauserella cavernicola]|uniref:Helix-turn-helix transcriptional regulator n=1 Tax=Prauserella cavernicola TaxID=2800127 RepID=A0A934V1G9_9PSEU|nr:winged helix-turn-helix domain-containing protein [Prauserella cavernicola]MBK1782921.1 helix-turn-helix transcriptional regulator [Prauserella cavernicola]
MTEPPPRRHVHDAELLRALAHPLRVELLGHLLSVGGGTATECASAVGSTASNCSWHLRQLERFGLVERSEGGNSRERPWRATAVGLDFGRLDDDPATRAAQLGVLGASLAEEDLLTQRFLDTVGEQPSHWRDAAVLNGYSLRITPDELTALTDAVDRLIRPYVSAIRADAPDDARVVHAGLRAFLRLDAQGRPSA